MRRRAALVLLLLCAACTPDAAPPPATGAARTVVPAATTGYQRMGPRDVVETFIGAPWSNGKGVYLFRADGTYRFTRDGSGQVLGPWPFVVYDDGTIQGPTATFAFFRTPTGYVYENVESGIVVPAYPG